MISGAVNGWGEQQEDGTWTAYCEVIAGAHVTTVHETGFKNERDAELWSRERAKEANAIIKANGMKIRKKFDCQIKAVK